MITEGSLWILWGKDLLIALCAVFGTVLIIGVSEYFRFKRRKKK